MSENPVTSSAESPPPRRRRWVDWLLISIGLACLTLYGLQKLRYQRAKADIGPKVVPGFVDVERVPLAPGAARDYNVLLITLDTTRADVLGCYGNRGIKTPTLDGLARDGLIFSEAFTSSPTTVPGHATILTGLYPHHHGARANGTFVLPEKTTTLAELFKNAGYATGAFISAYVLDARFGMDQGFDHYDDDLSKGVKYTDQSFRERPAEFTKDSFLSWLDGIGPSKFFAWVHFFDAHAPYVPPEPFRTEYSQRPYEGELAYVDSQIAALLKSLEEKGLREKTIIVVAGDHGESHGEHGEVTHGLLIYGATLRTPLIFNVPGLITKGQVIRRPVCNIAIAPTLVDLADVNPGSATFDGASLLRDPGQWPAALYGESISTWVLHGWAALFSVRRGDLRYIHAPKPELYDLAKDPRELHNLLGEPQYDAVVADLRKLLDEFLGDDDYGRGALTQMIEMDEETARRLSALGYTMTRTKDEADMNQAVVDPKDMIDHWSQVQRALHLQGAGNVREAAQMLEDAIVELPNDVFALRSLGACYMLLGEYAKAGEMYRRALEREKNDPGIYSALAQVTLVERKPAEAEALFRKALEVDPEYGLTYVGLAKLAMNRGRVAEAERLLRQAIEVDPGTTGPAAYNELGNMYISLGEREKARAAFEETIKLDELNGNARTGLGSLLAEAGKFQEAEAMFAEALRFEPAQAFSLSALAGLLDKKGQYAQAKALAEKALSLQADYGPALNNLALIEKHLGNMPRAIELLDKILTATPSHVIARINLAQCYYAQHDKARAVEQYQEVLKISPRVPIALANLGLYELERGRVDEAAALLERAIQADPGYAFAHAQYGALLLHRGRAAEALAHLKKSLELDPEQETRGQLEHQIGALEQTLAAENSPAPASPPPDAGTSGS